MKNLPDYHYTESKEDWEKRVLGKDAREIEDEADREYHIKKDDEATNT